MKNVEEDYINCRKFYFLKKIDKFNYKKIK